MSSLQIIDDLEVNARPIGKSEIISDAMYIQLNLARHQWEKDLFHTLAKKYCAELARIYGYKRDEYSIRSNKMGRNVLGDVVLHAKDMYIQFNEHHILIRPCSGMADYQGEPKRLLSWSKEPLILLSLIDKIRRGGV